MLRISLSHVKNSGLAALFAITSLVAAAAPLFLYQVANAAGPTSSTQVVKEENVSRQAENTPPTKNWVIYTRNAGTATFRSGPGTAPLGAGSIELSTPTGADKTQVFNYDHISTKLSDINALGYSTYRSAGSAQQVTALNIEVDVNGSAPGGFTTLVFEPVYNTSQGAVADNTWQTWDAYSGGNAVWWSSNPIPGALTRDNQVTWSSILAQNPDAVIVGGFGLNQGSGNPALTTAVDKLVFGTTTAKTTYDFEPTLAPSKKDDCKNNGWQKFNTPNFKNQGQCVSYVEHHSSEVEGDVSYTAYSIMKRQAWFHMNTADNDGWFVYADANHDWYGVRVSSVKVDGDSAWFAGQVDHSKDGKYNGNWLFAKVTDGKPNQISGSWASQSAALAGVRSEAQPADGPFNVTKGNLKIDQKD